MKASGSFQLGVNASQMMRWDRSQRSGHTALTGHVEHQDLADALDELWRTFLGEVVPLQAPVEWDAVLVDIRMDSGQLVMIPNRTGTKHRIDRALCQIILPGIQQKWECLAGAGQPQEQFDTAVSDEEKRIALTLLKVGQRLGVGRLLGKPNLKMICISGDAEGTLLEAIL